MPWGLCIEILKYPSIYSSPLIFCLLTMGSSNYLILGLPMPLIASMRLKLLPKSRELRKWTLRRSRKGKAQKVHRILSKGGPPLWELPGTYRTIQLYVPRIAHQWYLREISWHLGFWLHSLLNAVQKITLLRQQRGDGLEKNSEWGARLFLGAV